MSRRKESRDPLRARTSRIKKHTGQQKQKRNYPAWYIRLLRLTITGDRDVEEYDFDEDISELEEDPDDGPAEERFCDCDGEEDPECVCQIEDRESERSHDDSGAEKKKEKAELREYDRTKQDEVRAAYQSLKDKRLVPQQNPVESLATGWFDLFSTDLIDFCYITAASTKRRFDIGYPIQEDGKIASERPKDWDGIIYCSIYIQDDELCEFEFPAPKYASLEPITLRSHYGGHKVSVIFIGNGYMKITLSRKSVFMASHRPVSPGAQEFFEFFGIIRDEEKARAEGLAAEEKRAREQPPSPRETFFEMYHPMGSWNQSRWL
ncbi:hypothetical protein BGZ61DRAFT_593110 [Ilyonectria robusta]|uniref:uncharacterized protein n=1 Tax=Ilyonectria robusta TaxID=1079257 RepID=UPI001E8E5B99|nr:uncharacterized protein BGZ61DRAFT_593110 [Ilyonectria robusta]KAH8665398.1 hypothetical protein BGZ61DRAFT_593110 [Ilyonectria robusta]